MSQYTLPNILKIYYWLFLYGSQFSLLGSLKGTLTVAVTYLKHMHLWTYKVDLSKRCASCVFLLPGSRRPGRLNPMRLCSLYHFALIAPSPSGRSSVHSVLHSVKSTKKLLPIYSFANVALLSSALLTAGVHTELTPTVVGVHSARFPVSLSTLCTVALQNLLLGTCS
jgi:hypothetical protein